MRLQDCNWMDVERYLRNDDRIILVTGTTEQHAYLSLLTDILIPAQIADMIAQREQVLVAPPLNFGVSPYFREYPGTISLSPQTFEHVVLEIFEGLCHQGFHKFLILNGHGGNPIPKRLEDFQNHEPIRVIWFNWWQSATVATFEQKHNLVSYHANWSENFPFTRVAAAPQSDKPPVDVTRMNWEQPAAVRAHVGDGNFGGPYQVDDALMAELLALLAEEAVALLRSLAAPSPQP